MATFISAIKFTDQGIQAIKETTKQASALKCAAKKMSVKVKWHYFPLPLWLLGFF